MKVITKFLKSFLWAIYSFYSPTSTATTTTTTIAATATAKGKQRKSGILKRKIIFYRVEWIVFSFRCFERLFSIFFSTFVFFAAALILRAQRYIPLLMMGDEEHQLYGKE
jgi:hypothetical protein